MTDSLEDSTGGSIVKSIVQLYERRSCSKSIQEENKHDVESAMEARRSLRQNNFQQHVESRQRGDLVVELPVGSPTDGVLVVAKSPVVEFPIENSADVVAKGPAPPASQNASSDSSTEDVRRGNRGEKRKSSSLHKEIVQAVDNVSRTIADSIDRIHTANAQIAENRVKAQEVLFYKEFEYLKKRDRRAFCIQKNLISAIIGLTEIITTGLKNAACAGDASKEIVSEGDAD